MNEAAKIKAVIAAGDPLEDRVKGKGYHIYFNNTPEATVGRIQDCRYKDMIVYYIPEFKDFSALTFTPDEVSKCSVSILIRLVLLYIVAQELAHRGVRVSLLFVR